MGASLSVPGTAAARIIVHDGATAIEGTLEIPPRVRGVLVFAHGSGSSRFSPRNRAVAATLRQAGFATLLLDLLTPEEAAQRGNVFDIALLTSRLVAAVHFVRGRPEIGHLPVGFFGASTGAAAALAAAAALGQNVGAVVSRGGRIDLAGAALERVSAPTLCIVGARDEAVLQLTSTAMRELTCIRELVVVPGASHLFEEPGTLEEVARLAANWFDRFLTGA